MTCTNRRGFTLVEALVVVSVIGIVAVIGAPMVSAALQKRSSATAADQLVLTQSLARSTAIRFGRVSQLHIDAAGQRFWVDVDTSANAIGQRATIANIRYANDSTLQMTSNRSLLCFDARGMASTLGSCESGDMQVVFSRGQTADTVVTTSLGKVLR
ncbi:MAG: pilus assembly FimT family protein [Gemmatimonadaceae bacterium]